ncbi:CPBP family intramembrane metalloprotease [bacterium]|nr:CPBP family intramembrane metalloprotease [bacterium]
MDSRKRSLIISSVLVFPFTFAVFNGLPLKLPQPFLFGYSMGIYWIFLIVTMLIMEHNPLRTIAPLMQKTAVRKRSGHFFRGLAWLPAVPVFFMAFLPNAGIIGFQGLVTVGVIALINGTLEEVYWRGFYTIRFPDKSLVLLGLSPLLFGLWHVSLWFVKGTVYYGGFAALVGGAFFMGLVWSLCAWKLRNISTCIAAHVLVNFFAFTGLFADNQS